MKRGLFITFEGSDGSGKSTQIRKLKDYLKNNGYDAILTREPGGTKIGEEIRRIILNNANKEMSYMTEALLYAAARAQHVDEIIRPNLEAGKTVISDRFLDSSIVYQGFGRDLGGSVEDINSFAVGDCIPDVTFLLKLDPEVGRQRVRRKKMDRIESESELYHDTVYNAYLELEKANPKRIVGIDASGDIDEISEDIINRVRKLINEK